MNEYLAQELLQLTPANREASVKNSKSEDEKKHVANMSYISARDDPATLISLSLAAVP